MSQKKNSLTSITQSIREAPPKLFAKPALLYANRLRYSNRKNFWSKNFWNESSIQVETRKAPAVQVLKYNFHIPIFEH